MKKFLAITALGIATFIGCKNQEKQATDNSATPIKKTTTAAFNTDTAEKTIGFTAYKTTEKKPVNGEFTKINIIKNGQGNSVKEAIENVEFEIPVSSIETNDSGRNYKIQKFFFGVLKNSLKIKGKLNLTDTSKGNARFTLNEVTKDIPFNYNIENNTFSMNGVLDINKWNAQQGIQSLNNACKDLHKGADGVSKTWNEVAIKATVKF